MRSILIALTLAASALLPAAAGAECLPSPEAVRAIHGQGAWSKWHTVKGQRCYFVGERPARATREVHEESPPLPRQRPESAPPATQPPPAPSVQLVDLAPNESLREAMTEWLRGKYWVLMWRARN